MLELRNAKVFGPEQRASIMNECLAIEGRAAATNTTYYNILARNCLVEAEGRARKRYKCFEWRKPDELVRYDPTEFNSYPALTMEDDHSREGWAGWTADATDDMVMERTTHLHPKDFENFLTDYGRQFYRMNSDLRRYSECGITGKGIWSLVHHHQTLGKLSIFQKGLKAFLINRLGRSTGRGSVDKCIRT
ncbi:MAG: hypothetical protein JRN46_02075 [Nitrososphaerota archaeon]|nr:hypothetical protein [Nitrososphaerota archaeon]